MTTEDDFQRQLDANPDDHQTRLVFADWLEEHGDPRAAGYRALGALGRRPNYYKGHPGQIGPYVLPEWDWGTTHNPHSQEGKSYHNMPHFLPDDWHKLIPHQVVNGYGETDQEYWRYHPDRRDADDAAAHAFSQLPPERQQEIMNSAQPKQFTRRRLARKRYST